MYVLPQLQEGHDMIRQMRKRVLIVILTIITILLLGWRLWPHSLYDIFQIEQGSISSLSISVTESAVKNGHPFSHPFINRYDLNGLSSDSNDYSAILSILENSQYRSDFRNLLPWDINVVSSSNSKCKYSAYITLCWSNTKTNYSGLGFLNVSATDLEGENGFLIFHPTNRNTLDNLAAYLIEHGERS